MMAKTGTRMLLAVALLMVVPSSAWATHFSQYLFTPTTHDDMGRSDEPNFAGLTAILGPAVGDRNVDTNLDGRGESYQPGLSGPGLAKVVAPGCTDNAGRQPSGLCGLWTIGAGTYTTGTLVPAGIAGVRGMTGGQAPGRFTRTTATAVRIFDVTANLDVAFGLGPASVTQVTLLDLNHAVRDSPAAGPLAVAGVTAPFVAGPTSFLTWYGTWTDKNGNGVIDFGGKKCDQTNGCGTDGGVTASNEFVWDGNCIGISGDPAPAGQQYCHVADPPVAMPMWVFPGDHHASCYSSLPLKIAEDCASIGLDYPGHQVVCLADASVGIATGVYPSSITGPMCEGWFTGTTDVADMDEFDQSVGGDALLGPQDSVRYDDLFSDRTGDPAVDQRNWVWGSGFPVVFYDNSLVTTTTTLAAVTTQTQPDPGTATQFDVRQASFTDVDRYVTWSPLADNLLNGANGVKATSRSAWVPVRDTFIPVQRATDGITHDRIQYDQCDPTYLGVCPLGPGSGLGPTEGKVDDAVFSAGIPHEPNTAADVEPGAQFGAAGPACLAGADSFKGWCNDYAGYAADWHAWVDVQDFPGTYVQMGWSDPLTGGCVVCAWSGPSQTPTLPSARLGGESGPWLQPGAHLFAGIVGAWKDRVQAHSQEQVLDVAALPALTLRHVGYGPGDLVAPDGWVGDVLNATGYLRSRGYFPETCTIGGVTAQREYALCHPYADGNRDYPPDSYTSNPAAGGEFQPAQSVSGGNTVAGQLTVSISPNRANPGSNDCWNVPILVWRQIDHWTVGNLADLQNYQGKCGADAVITMPLGLNSGGVVDDELLLPEGNLGQTVVTATSALAVTQPPTVNGMQPPAVTEFVQDVDVYVPYSA